jgi:hypothetical protein
MEWSASANVVLDELCGEWPEWEAAYDPEWPSDITDDGSPFELSIELGGDEPLVRMLIEPQTRPREGESWAMSSWRAGLAATERLRALGADLSRYEAIRDLYAPLPSIGVRFSVWHACTLGSGHPRDFKVYLNPQVVGSEAAPLLVARTMSELGLETADDEVQRAIRRFHTLAEFDDAAARVKGRGLVLVGHAILGLPGDGRAGARNTARALGAAGCDGVKVHHLMILRRTQMEKAWKSGALEVLDARTYVDWLADFVERLGPAQVLHRLTGDSPPADLLAPVWSVHKNDVRARLAAELARRGTVQGALAAAERA